MSNLFTSLPEHLSQRQGLHILQIYDQSQIRMQGQRSLPGQECPRSGSALRNCVISLQWKYCKYQPPVNI